MKVSKRPFGKVDGEPVYEYTLVNTKGMQLSAMNYGAAVTAILMPDKFGKNKNIVLGFDSVDKYVEHRPFYGATIGRVAGRIAGGKFKLKDKTVQVMVNEGENHHHGGNPAFESRFWTVETKAAADADEGTLTFTYVSPDGENGYPGNLTVQVVYTLTEQNEWKIHYTATTDETTLFNPTNHVYFNLTGDHTKGVLEHELQLNSDCYAPLREDSIPTGELADVTDTDFDFRQSKPLKTGVDSDHPQLQLNRGYDHPFVLNHSLNQHQADGQISDPVSGRRVWFTTDREAVVVYLNNWADGAYDIDSQPVLAYSGVALETQTLPDAINHKNFGNSILNPGETFQSETVYHFDLI